MSNTDDNRTSHRGGHERREPLRVLMFSWEYPPHLNGGMGSHVKALVPALAELGAEIHLITPRLKAGEPVETLDTAQGEITVHRVEPARWQTGDIVTDAHEVNARLTAYTEFLIGEDGPFDLVHAHDWLVALSAFHFKHEYKWPLVATIHATERGRSGGVVHGPLSVSIDHIEWQLCYETWRIIVTSQYMADQLSNFWQVPLDKISIVPNGIDLSRYQRYESEDLTAFRRRFAADDERIVFHIGRLVHEKGTQTLIEAAPRILAEFPKVRFLIAGRGPMYDELQGMATELGVSDRVDFLGFISDRERDGLYHVADVAAFPSLYEPFGIVALEAMAAGVPVVASDVGGLAEVVDTYEAGIAHAPGDPGSLARAVRETLRNTAEVQTWAENALEEIRTEFSWAHVAEETVAVYEQVVQERRHVDW